MTAPHANQLIDGYLARIQATAADLPAGARNELLDDIRSHIAEARSRQSEETDASILNILDRLGEPDTVVAEARHRSDPSAAARPDLRTNGHRPGILEIAALILLPFLWIVGVILVWVSPAWKTRDKVIGSVFSVGGYPGLFIIGAGFSAHAGHRLLGISSGFGCVSIDAAGNCLGPTPWQVIGSILSVVAVVVVFLLPAITSAYLAMRLHWGRRLEVATA